MVHSPRRSAVGSRDPVHLLCPRCGWAITLKTRWLAIRHCPRCVARRHVTVRLVGPAPAPPARQQQR